MDVSSIDIISCLLIAYTISTFSYTTKFKMTDSFSSIVCRTHHNNPETLLVSMWELRPPTHLWLSPRSASWWIPAGAGACIYLGSVPTLHYSAQPGPHLQPPPVNTTALASLYVIKTCCLVDQVQPVFALIWPILPIFSALLQFCLPSSPGSFIQKLPWIPHTAVALKWKQSDFLESKYLKTDYFL